MTNELTIFKNGAVPSLKFKGAELPKQRLDDGVSAGFARISYKGSKWGIRYQGAYTPIQARMPTGELIQSPFLDVVILRAAGHPNKAWYAGAYSEGEMSQPPDCWSSNGQVPDAGAPNRQSTTCLGCKWNVWGSKINRDTGLATKGKACMDSKRLAVVPVGDIMNVTYGGPMMLSVPPSSLKRLGPYQNMLEAATFHYASVWTRITFESESAYPLFNFDAIAPLNDVQADQVLAMVKHPVIDRILDTESVTVEAWDESAASVHSSIKAEPVQPAGGDPAPQFYNRPSSTPDPHTAAVAAQAALAQAAPLPAAPIPAEPVQAQSIPTGYIPPAPDEPQAEAPEQLTPALPSGVTLPAGMTPEMAAAFMAQFNATAQNSSQATAKRGRKPRTPPVSPEAGASATTSLAGPALPAPVGPGEPMASEPAPAATPLAGSATPPVDPVASIMSTIERLT